MRSWSHSLIWGCPKVRSPSRSKMEVVKPSSRAAGILLRIRNFTRPYVHFLESTYTIQQTARMSFKAFFDYL